MADDIINLLVDKENEVMQIYLAGKAAKTGASIEEYIQSRLVQGVSLENIKKELINDLETGGPFFGDFLRSVKATAQGNMSRLRNIPIFEENGLNAKYRWVAVLVNTCPDCMDRHGQVKTWEDWEDEGLPQTGATICEQRWGIGTCRCMLMPETSTILEPIKRKK